MTCILQSVSFLSFLLLMVDTIVTAWNPYCQLLCLTFLVPWKKFVILNVLWFADFQGWMKTLQCMSGPRARETRTELRCLILQHIKRLDEMFSARIAKSLTACILHIRVWRATAAWYHEPFEDRLGTHTLPPDFIFDNKNQSLLVCCVETEVVSSMWSESGIPQREGSPRVCAMMLWPRNIAISCAVAKGMCWICRLF